jgi:uncharacterized protein (DUF2132 family)
MPSPSHHPRDPLHGVTLQDIVTRLHAEFGWEEMGKRIPVRCFLHNPSLKSSLTFLRKTPWAREKVEMWYLREHWRKTPRAAEADPETREEKARGEA